MTPPTSIRTPVPRPEAADLAAALETLGRRFGDRLAAGRAIREQHANTLTWLSSEPPDAVVWPLSTAEVAEIVAVAARHRIPLVAFGAGTSLEGHVNAPHGGISVDLSRMDRIVAVHPRDFDCTVEAGVTRDRLDAHLRDTGLHFPVDPGAGEATLGGMASTRASGTTAVRYGTMRDNVKSLTAVFADGRVVRTGARAIKSSAGYDLTRLLIGAEGTLGIVTELTLRLHPRPDAVTAAVVPFATLSGACETAIEAIQSGLPLVRVELLDEVQIEAVNRHERLALPVAPTLFVELSGATDGTGDDVAAFEAIARGYGATGFEWACDADQRRRLWRARHNAYWAIRALNAGKAILATDVCVPISRLAECVAETAADARRTGLVAPILGHVGDGNFHATPVFDAADPAAVAALKGFLDRLAARALVMDGTCTGEHGIGQGKIAHLARELGPAVDVMRAIKAALDPFGLLNPGKIFPGAYQGSISARDRSAAAPDGPWPDPAVSRPPPRS